MRKSFYMERNTNLPDGVAPEAKVVAFSALRDEVITAIRVLIVEDEGIIATHIASRLRKSGYEVIGIAESSEDTLALVQELRPDLILMDIRIKGTSDGIETAAELHTRFDIPVIYLTAHTDQQTLDRARMTGAAGFLTKPIQQAALKAAIETAIHKHRADRAARHPSEVQSTAEATPESSRE
jgi:AmiR/NasT family two-component response regulator